MKLQHGATLPLLLLLLLASGSWMLQQLSSDQWRLKQQQQTRAALAQAKQALLSYSVLYDQSHSGQSFGYLPCPDRNASNGEGSSNPSCGSKNISQLGRLPWRTLEINAVRDGLQQCLWYALAGSFKNNPNTDLLNWDTTSPLQVYNADGQTLISPDPIIAVLIAAGNAQPNQNRHADGSSPFCGGNYQAQNYLDQHPTLNINNSNISQNQLIHGNINSPINDQFLTITRRELFDAIKRRPDFSLFVQQLLQQGQLCNLPPIQLNFTNSPHTEVTSPEIIGNLHQGRLPKSCLNGAATQWQDQLLYRRCLDGNACLSVNNQACRAIVIFVGEKQNNQQRNSASDKQQWSNYLEGNTLSAFINGDVSFQGETLFDHHQPSLDLLACQI